MDQDDELQAIRAKRLAELQAAQGSGSKGAGSNPNAIAAKEQQEKQEEMRNSILSQILSQEARARRKYLLYRLVVFIGQDPFS